MRGLVALAPMRREEIPRFRPAAPMDQSVTGG